jgi:hypothetical protein
LGELVIVLKTTQKTKKTEDYRGNSRTDFYFCNGKVSAVKKAFFISLQSDDEAAKLF